MNLRLPELVRGASAAFVWKVAATVLGFGVHLVVARLLGADGAGLYYLTLAIVTLATVLGRAGLDNVLLRFVAAQAAGGKWAAVSVLSRRSLRVAGAVSCALALLLVVAAAGLAGSIFLKPGLAPPLRWMAFAAVPTSLFLLYGELLKAVHRPGQGVFVQEAAMPLALLALLPWLAGRMSVAGAGVAHLLGSIAVLAAAVFLWRRATPPLGGGAGPVRTRELLSTAVPFLWVAVLSFVMTWTDVLILGRVADRAEVGAYAIAARIASLVAFFLVAANSVVAPRFAALHAAGRTAELDRLARRAARITALLALPAVLLFTLAPAPVLRLFGPGFPAAAPALTVLAVGQFVNVATGSVGYLLLMTGNERLMQHNMAAAAGLNIVLNAVLAPRYGALGAAWATTLSLACLNLTAAVMVYRRLAIWTVPIPFRRARHGR